MPMISGGTRSLMRPWRAVETALTHPELGVGVHFTLVNGFPVLPPEEIPSLVTEKGVFYDDYIHFVKRFLAGRIRMEEVRRELAAQAEKMAKTGLSLTHVDGHQHMHVLPGIFDAALDAGGSSWGGSASLLWRKRRSGGRRSADSARPIISRVSWRGKR